MINEKSTLIRLIDGTKFWLWTIVIFSFTLMLNVVVGVHTIKKEAINYENKAKVECGTAGIKILLFFIEIWTNCTVKLHGYENVKAIKERKIFSSLSIRNWISYSISTSTPDPIKKCILFRCFALDVLKATVLKLYA